MELNIHSTWGDRHYLGLNGIEIFSSTGEPVSVGKVISDTFTNFLQNLQSHSSLSIEMFEGVHSDDQWRTQEFCSGGGGSTNSVEDRENGDLGVVAP
jgi:hypothetical protein